MVLLVMCASCCWLNQHVCCFTLWNRCWKLDFKDPHTLVGLYFAYPITVNSSIDIGVPSSHPTKSDSIEYWILSDSLDWLKGNLTAKRHILMGKSMVSCNQSAEQNPSSEQWMVARMVSETVMRVIPLCRKASCFI